MEAAAMGGKSSTTPSTEQNRNSKSEYMTETQTWKKGKNTRVHNQARNMASEQASKLTGQQERCQLRLKDKEDQLMILIDPMDMWAQSGSTSFSNTVPHSIITVTAKVCCLVLNYNNENTRLITTLFHKATNIWKHQCAKNYCTLIGFVIYTYIIHFLCKVFDKRHTSYWILPLDI